MALNLKAILFFALSVLRCLPASLSGVVVDEQGHPVAGAEVVLSAPDSVEDLRGASVSGSRGRFKLQPAALGLVTLTVRHPDYADLRLEGVEIPAGPAAVHLGPLTLAAGGVLEGKVTGAGGKPIEGAEVWIRGDFDESLTPEPSVKTGPDGIFRVPGLRRGERFVVTAWRQGYIPASLGEVPAPPEVPVRIELKPVRGLSGRVVDSEGDPVAEAIVKWKARDYFLPRYLGEVHGPTDAEGRFRLDGLPSGSVDIAASADGYFDRSVDNLVIPEGGDLEGVRIILQQAHVLDVRVVDAGGEPVVGALVTARREDDDSDSPNQPGDFTDSSGRCRIPVDPKMSYQVGTGLSPRDPWDLLTRACHPKTPSTLVHIPPGTGETPVELRALVSKGVAVSGRILGENGTGLPGIQVDLMNLTIDDLTMACVSKTEADGSFLFSGIAEGRYTLKASRVPGDAASVEVQVAGQPVRDVELRLGPEEKGATLSGRILGVPSADLPRTRVTARDSESRDLFGTVGLRGTYQIQGAYPGEWDLTVIAPQGNAGGTVQISQGQTEATLDLEVGPRLILSGRVLLDGKPFARASFEVSEGVGDGAKSYSSETAYDGTFRLNIRKPGFLTLTFLDGPGKGIVRTLQFDKSQEILVDLSSEPD